LAQSYVDLEAQGKYVLNSETEILQECEILLQFLKKVDSEDRESLLEEYMLSSINMDNPCLGNLINYSYVFFKEMFYSILPNLIKDTGVANSVINIRIFKKIYEEYREFMSSCNFYNPNMFIPNNDFNTNELISIMVPECLVKTSTMLIVHPEATQRYNEIIEVLKEMEYHGHH
jgi:hypothetical protein